MATPAKLSIAGLILIAALVASAKDKSGGSYGAIPVGPTGIVGYFKGGSPHLTVIDVAKTSPADGKIVKGDVLLSVNGRELSGYPDTSAYPKPWYTQQGSRYVLGDAITQAEAKDGSVKFELERAGSSRTVEVRIPVLGAYSQTWPISCLKSDKIVDNIAAFLLRIQNKDGYFDFPEYELPKGVSGNANNLIGQIFAALFLMSTGEQEHMPAVKRFAAKMCEGGGSGNSSWYLGYRGTFLGEYYLRTGDRKAKEALAEICANLAAHDKVGSWAHRLDSTSGGYVRGGLMNQAGINCFRSYLLARECGIEIDEPAFLRTLHFFYKFAGKGATPYGDHRPRINANANGKGPSTVCAYIVMEDPRATRAAQMGALCGVDSYYGLEGGHTGNGFNVIWRGIAAAHVPREFDARRQQCMAALTWYYDLARGYDGSVWLMPVPGGETRYASTCWGTGGIGLHYTAHRRTLRMTGKPRGPRNANPKLPPDELWRWWEQPDNHFLRMGFCKGGRDISDKTEAYYHWENPTVEQCETMIRHYDNAVRKTFAHYLGQISDDGKTISPKALDAIGRALIDPDERVQRAATEAISGYDPWFSIGKIPTLVDANSISERFAPQLIQILRDPKTDIWLKDGALWALARARSDTVLQNLPLFEKFDNDRLWWLRHASRWRVNALAQDGKVTMGTLSRIVEAKETEGRCFATVDLTKLIQLATDGDSTFTPAERRQIVERFINLRRARREGTAVAVEKKDAYGYKSSESGEGGISMGDLFIYLASFAPEELIPTYPELIHYLDDVANADSTEAYWTGLFYGVKRFKGAMPKIKGAKAAARPVMQRLKEFVYTDDRAAARAKMEKQGMRSLVDAQMMQLRKDVTEFEKLYGPLTPVNHTRTGKTYRPVKRIQEEVLDPSGEDSGEAQQDADDIKTVTWAGTFVIDKTEIQRKGKTEIRTSYAVQSGSRKHDIPGHCVNDLPVLFEELEGAQVNVSVKGREHIDRRPGKSRFDVVELLSFTVIKE